MSCIYVFRLGNRCWYVGMGVDPFDDFYKHCKKDANCEWTSRHKPEFISLIQLGGPDDATILTLQFIRIYGLHVVRGYPYIDANLSIPQREEIISQISKMVPVCIGCGIEGHFARKCKTSECSRCYRYGHSPVNCSALRDRMGMLMNDEYFKSSCSICGRRGHKDGLWCPYQNEDIAQFADDILTSKINGVTAIRRVNDHIEYCISTENGDIWERFSVLSLLDAELKRRFIIVDGFPYASIVGEAISWWYGPQSTIEFRRSALNKYFNSLPRIQRI